MKMGLIHRITLLPLVAATLANAQNDATTTNIVTPMDENTTEENINNSANMTNNNATIVEEEETDTGTAPNYTPEECNSWVNTIVSADADSSNGLSESEYHNFLSSINDPPYIEEFFSNYDSFDNLPWVFRVVHKSLACHCEKLGKGEECCEGDNAEVLLLGLDDSTGGRAAGAEEEEYKDLVCQQISYILARSVPSPAPTSGPTETPTDSPSGGPTSSPTSVRPTSVTNLPTVSIAPTSLSPTLSPVQTPPEPTVSPVTPPAPETPQPTDVPSISLKPTIGVVLAAAAEAQIQEGNTEDDEEDGGLGVGGAIGILVALLAIILAILALITYRRKQEQQRLKQFAGDQAPEGDLEAPVVPPVVKAEVAPQPVPEKSPEPEQAVEPNEDDESSAPSVWSAGDEDGDGANADLMDDNLDVSATVGSSLAAMGAAGAAVTMINKSESQ